MPPKRFKTQAGHRDAISCASSYAFNSGNKEAPWYGVQNRYLSDLLSPNMSLYPQYRLDLQSSLWRKQVKASSAPNSAAAPNRAAPSSAPPSTAAPSAAAGPQPPTHDSHAAGSTPPDDEPVDLHLDDNSDPDELDALTADTHHTDEDSEAEKAKFMAVADANAEEGAGQVHSDEGDDDAEDDAEARAGDSGTEGDDEAESDEDDEGEEGGKGGDEGEEGAEGVDAPEAKRGDGVAVNEGDGASESNKDEGEVEDEDVIVDFEGAAGEESASDGCTDDSEDEDREDVSEDEEAGGDVENGGDQQDIDAVIRDGQEHEEQRATQEDGVNNLEVAEDAHVPPSASEPVQQGRQLRPRANQAQMQTAAASETDAPDPGQPANRTAHQYTSPFPDGKSDTSRKTLKDKKAISRYPDFAITHTTSAKMSSTPVDGEDAALHAVKLEIHCGRKTLHRCLLLIEEDKRAPSRRLTGEERDDDIERKLAQAAMELVEYVSAYFYAVPHSPGVIGRVTSGIYWKWLFITRQEVPQYDTASKQTKADKVNQDLMDTLVAKYVEDTPTYNLGDKESDLALNAMRKRFTELARDCKKSH